MKRSLYLILLIALIALAACRQNKYKVDISGIDLDIRISRLDKELFEQNPAELKARLAELKVKDAGFLKIFSYVINISDTEDEKWESDMMRFATDRQNVEVYSSVKEVFDDISTIEKEMIDAWKHYKYYFPEQSVPSIYTCLSGFNNSIIVGEEVIGIGLDRYLGSDNKYYPMLGIYSYLRAKMIPERIVPDCMYGWAASTWELPSPSEGSSKLVDYILHQGRLLYFTRSMLPEISDTLLFGFSTSQMQFCENNEAQMWEYIMEHDLLFSTDPMVIKKLTEDAPFTTYFTSESPGKAANWIGFRIVESYMQKNPGRSLADLMALESLSQVLEQSKYSP